MISTGLLMLLSAACLTASGQRVAILTPDRTLLDDAVASNTRAAMIGTFRIQDLAMSDAALEASGKRPKAFNLSTDDARDLAAVLGCDFFIMIRTGTLRRASLEKADYAESFAVFFVVSGRTGRLVTWKLFSEMGADAADSEHRLTHSLVQDFLYEAITAARKSDPAEQATSAFEPIPEPDSPDAKNFKAPVPYRRIKPEYTRTAYLYDITATVEATVDLDEKGQITNIAITRWAGFDLDESVEKTIRAMNWRPAERNGKPLPARFLLRYNFRKIEKEDPR